MRSSKRNGAGRAPEWTSMLRHLQLQNLQYVVLCLNVTCQSRVWHWQVYSLKALPAATRGRAAPQTTGSCLPHTSFGTKMLDGRRFRGSLPIRVWDILCAEMTFWPASTHISSVYLDRETWMQIVFEITCLGPKCWSGAILTAPCTEIITPKSKS